MEIFGIPIETRPIAEGAYDQFTESEKAAVSIGLLPADRMEVIRRLLGEKFDQIAVEQCVKDWGGEWIAPAVRPNKEMREKFVREVEHKIAVDIYGYAADLGRMVV